MENIHVRSILMNIIENCEELREWIENNPIKDLKDKVTFGEEELVPIVTETIEEQIKNISRRMQEYVFLLEQADKLRRYIDKE